MWDVLPIRLDAYDSIIERLEEELELLRGAQVVGNLLCMWRGFPIEVQHVDGKLWLRKELEVSELGRKPYSR
jgi:hypothetical protein